MPTVSLGENTPNQLFNKFWTAGDIWTDTSLTLSFPQSVTPYWSYQGVAASDFTALNAGQQTVFNYAAQLWADLADITVTNLGNGDTGQLRAFGVENADATWGAKVGSSPGYGTNMDTQFNTGRVSSDGTTTNFLNTMALDNLELSLHELGHAFGLGHPGDYDTGDTVGLTDQEAYDEFAEYIEDSEQYTLMSYFEADRTGADHGGNPQDTPMLHDIFAIQRLYGADLTTRNGNTTYGYNASGLASPWDQITYDFDVNIDPVLAIWDAGGADDTLDLDGDASGVVLDLRPGAFSSTHGMTDNIALAFNPNPQMYPALDHFIENGFGGAGNDMITGNAKDNVIGGRRGNDLLVGLSGHDTISGGRGDDYITGGGGFDTLEGRRGNDAIFGGNGADLIRGQLGNDTLFGANGNDTIYAGRGRDNIYGEDGNDRLVGQAGHDAIVGGHGHDSIEGGAGHDQINGNGGSDMIEGNGGNDTISGGNGHDDISGGSGVDILDGNGGDDILRGNAHGDVLTGGRGADSLYGGLGNDVLNGGFGNDEFDGGQGNDTVLFTYSSANWTVTLVPGGGQGLATANASVEIIRDVENIHMGSGNDTVYGTIEANQLRGGRGDDTLEGRGGNDILLGQGGNDTLVGGSGNDYMEGNNGNDFFIAGLGNDTFDGGNGADTVDFSGIVVPTFVDLAVETPQATGFLQGNDRFENIESINGSQADDVLRGTLGSNLLNGLTGNDLIEGRAGNDVLNGGIGNDTASYESANATVTIDLELQGTVQNTGAGGIDTLISFENLIGSMSSDILAGDLIDNRIEGGRGHDWIFGRNGDDNLRGERGDDLIFGEGNNDLLFGHAGADGLNGGDGNDVLRGGTGADLIIGGSGNDELVGGAGFDEFRFGDNFGTDVISDFNALARREDINLSSVSSIVGWLDLNQNHMNQIGSHVVIDDLSGNTITLVDIDISDLNRSDFIFS